MTLHPEKTLVGFDNTAIIRTFELHTVEIINSKALVIQCLASFDHQVPKPSQNPFSLTKWLCILVRSHQLYLYLASQKIGYSQDDLCGTFSWDYHPDSTKRRV